MKQRLLIYAYFFHPNENANTNVVMPVLEELKKHYELDVFTCDVNENLSETDVWHEMNIIRYRPSRREKLTNKLFGVYDKSREDIRAPHETVKLRLWQLMHLCPRSAIQRVVNEYPMNRALLHCLESKPYCALLSLSAPIEPHRAALTLARKGKLKGLPWYAYFMDPHAAFIGLAQRYDSLMKEEMEIYEQASAVFTTLELYDDNQRHPLKKYLAKTIPVGYANLRPLNRGERPAYLSADKITCVYTGSLFSHAVRNPAYFFQMLDGIDERFEIHIVCYELDGLNRRLKEQYIDHNPRVIWHQRASMEECLNLMGWADILINLGNRCINQTPSKIFDYISAGKPIVNIHPLAEDTAKRYLDRYPLVLDVQEQEPFDPKDAESFAAYCTAHRGETVPFETVKALYGDMLAANAAQSFISAIDRDA